MSLHLHRSSSNRVLWESFTDRFFGELSRVPGPTFPAHAWLAHRSHRDLLLEEAESRGIGGWVGAPFAFLGDLPELLGVEGNPAGLLTRRRLLGRLAAGEGARHGIVGAGGRAGGVVRGHVLDGLFAELLPEGVTPDALRSALSSIETDDFAGRRNAWLVAVYERYRNGLAERGLFDPRSVPALLGRAVDDGRLTDAVAGASTLHLYGLHSLRTRTAMIGALARQDEVEVHAYLPAEDQPDEWDRLAVGAETLEAERPEIEVQPAPDQEREMRWVVERVKRLLRDGEVEPHRVAVVARTGLEDTRRAHRALEEAGVPATARIRTPLSEVAALRFVLELFRGAAGGWTYRPLRNVLSSPYIDSGVEVWLLDRIADERRIRGLEGWRDTLDAFRDELLRKGEPSDAQRALAGRVERSREALESFSREVAQLDAERSEEGWIDATLELLDPGIFWFRKRLSRPVSDRMDVVRLDQRGVLQLESLLREWRDLDLPDEPLDVEAWHGLLLQLVEGHTLTLSTPLQRGVQVLEAHDAALSPFEHVFVVHANDGEFPRLPRGGGVLTDHERRLLADRLPLSNRELDLRRERTLWRAVTGAERASVSYRTTDAAGQPLLPSLLVPEHEMASELSRVWKVPEAPVSEGEWLLSRARRLARGEGEGTSGSPVLSGALVAGVAEWQRQEQARVRRGSDLVASPWSGHLRDPAVLAELERRFGDDHVWSAGRLEAYGTCPFVFLVERVLDLGAWEEAEEETSPLAFGGIAHEVLELFYRRLDRPLPDVFDDRAGALLTGILEEVRARREAEGEWLGLPVLWRHTFRQIGEALRKYLAWELPLLAEKGHVPFETEHGFGFGDEEVALVGPDVAGELVTLRLHGRIDRVDAEEGADEARYHVVDYKSGKPPKAGGYHDGSTLQAALYMSAYATEKGVRCVKSGYRSIKDPGGKGSKSFVTWDNAKHRAALSAALGIPRRVRAGHFEPVRAAQGGNWPDWAPGREVTRGRAALDEGARFEAGPEGPPSLLGEGGGR